VLINSWWILFVPDPLIQKYLRTNLWSSFDDASTLTYFMNVHEFTWQDSCRSHGRPWSSADGSPNTDCIHVTDDSADAIAPSGKTHKGVGNTNGFALGEQCLSCSTEEVNVSCMQLNGHPSPDIFGTDQRQHWVSQHIVEYQPQPTREWRFRVNPQWSDWFVRAEAMGQ
jgi:hypothetical protein